MRERERMGKLLRMTRQRRVILDELRRVDSHPTADEVYGLVRRRMPGISLGTVYRNLEVLSREGLVLKVVAGGTRKRFDGTTRPHYHVRCVCCDRIDDIALEPVQDLEGRLRCVSEYEITGHRIEFTGVCPVCKNSGKMVIEGDGQEDERR